MQQLIKSYCYDKLHMRKFSARKAANPKTGCTPFLKPAMNILQVFHTAIEELSAFFDEFYNKMHKKRLEKNT